ncbi:hypothetical protein NUM3379_32700 [Kineococcus sp. NUM-3379]
MRHAGHEQPQAASAPRPAPAAPVAQVPAAAAAQGISDRAVQRQAALVSLVTVVVSAANYGFSLLVIRLLSAADYVQYASVQSLLLVLGTGCMAAVPWAVARHVALSHDPRAAGEALGFGLLASTAQGLVFALLALLVVVPASGWAMGGVTALAALALSLVAAPLGFLQGRQRIGTISWLRLLETAVRLGSSLLLLLAVAASPTAPVLGFTVGSLVLLVVGLALCREGWPLLRASAATFSKLLRESMSLAVVQIALAAVGVVDTVVIVFAALGDGPASAYQIAALLGRVPLFLSAAVALSYYQRIAGAADEAQARERAAGSLRLFALLGVPAAALLAGFPQVLLELVAPGRSAEVSALLHLTAVTGLGVGLLTVLSTVHQARGEFRRSARVLVPAALVQPVLLVAAGHAWGAAGYAAAGLVLVAVVLALFVADLRGRWLLAMGRGEFLPLAAGAVLAVAARGEPWLWPVAALVLGVVGVRGVLGGSGPAQAGEEPGRVEGAGVEDAHARGAGGEDGGAGGR